MFDLWYTGKIHAAIRWQAAKCIGHLFERKKNNNIMMSLPEIKSISACNVARNLFCGTLARSRDHLIKSQTFFF